MPDPHQPNLLTLAVKPFRDVAVFSGRSRRSEVAIFNTLTVFLVGEIDRRLDAIGTTAAFAGRWLVVVLWVVPLFALMTRRVHDFGKPGWIGWGTVVAGVGMAWLSGKFPGQSHTTLHWLPTLAGFALLLLYWTLILAPPSPGTNRYGPDLRPDPAPAAG